MEVWIPIVAAEAEQAERTRRKIWSWADRGFVPYRVRKTRALRAGPDIEIGPALGGDRRQLDPGNDLRARGLRIAFDHVGGEPTARASWHFPPSP